MMMNKRFKSDDELVSKQQSQQIMSQPQSHSDLSSSSPSSLTASTKSKGRKPAASAAATNKKQAATATANNDEESAASARAAQDAANELVSCSASNLTIDPSSQRAAVLNRDDESTSHTELNGIVANSPVLASIIQNNKNMLPSEVH